MRQTMDTDDNGHEYPALGVTDAGWDWIVANEDRFVLQRMSKKTAQSIGISDDDIPF